MCQICVCPYILLMPIPNPPHTLNKLMEALAYKLCSKILAVLLLAFKSRVLPVLLAAGNFEPLIC